MKEAEKAEMRDMKLCMYCFYHEVHTGQWPCRLCLEEKRSRWIAKPGTEIECRHILKHVAGRRYECKRCKTKFRVEV